MSHSQDISHYVHRLGQIPCKSIESNHVAIQDIQSVRKSVRRNAMIRSVVTCIKNVLGVKKVYIMKVVIFIWNDISVLIVVFSRKL